MNDVARKVLNSAMTEAQQEVWDAESMLFRRKRSFEDAEAALVSAKDKLTKLKEALNVEREYSEGVE